MKICLVGPGIMPIPPTGWGAVEILIWDEKLALEKLGHEVLIINTQNPNDILKEIDSFNPDFVHVQYDDFVELIPHIRYPCAITSHFGYLEQPNKWDYYGPRVAQKFEKIKPNVFCLSQGIKDTYKNTMGFLDENLFVTPNGVNLDLFRKTENPQYPQRSIYLAKIDYRKRQYLFQGIDSLWFAGNNSDSRFDVSKRWLQEWSKDKLYNELTDYGNLVLLSDGEAHPLVCLEAFAAGLGVVVSQYAAANLDTSKGFITVIPEDKITDMVFLESEIIKNRKYSIEHREEVLEYAETFEWSNVVAEYYVTAMEKIINRNKNKVAICFIGTGKYINFLPNYWRNIEENFLSDIKKEFFVFTDGEMNDAPDNITTISQEHLDWPYITLLRFNIINKIKKELSGFDKVIFMDADTLVVNKITEEEFFTDKPFFGVHHPCHYLKMPPHNEGTGSFETDTKSTAGIIDGDDTSVYFQGCLWGGQVPYVLDMISELELRTQKDLDNGIIAQWHDESQMNKFFAERRDDVHVLGPQYAYPEVFKQACNFEPKIVHLAKNNSEYHV
jgi:glycosyltransferase involved in cell wall biosynthesis